MSECLNSIQAGSLRVSHLYTHSFALDDFDQAVDVLVEKPSEALGVIVNP